MGNILIFLIHPFFGGPPRGDGQLHNPIKSRYQVAGFTMYRILATERQPGFYNGGKLLSKYKEHIEKMQTTMKHKEKYSCSLVCLLFFLTLFLCLFEN